MDIKNSLTTCQLGHQRTLDLHVLRFVTYGHHIAYWLLSATTHETLKKLTTFKVETNLNFIAILQCSNILSLLCMFSRPLNMGFHKPQIKHVRNASLSMLTGREDTYSFARTKFCNHCAMSAELQCNVKHCYNEWTYRSHKYEAPTSLFPCQHWEESCF